MDIDQVHDLMNQALQAEHRGQFDAARGLLRQVAAAGETPQALDARLRLGKLLIYGGQPSWPEAEEVLTAACLQAELAGATRTTAGALHLLALLERHRGQFDRAEELLAQSPVADQPADPSPARAQWLHYHGLIAADRGDLNNAERYCFRAHQVYQESRDDLGAAEVCDSLANLLLRRGKVGYALVFARTSLELKQRLGDRYGEAVSHGTAGRAFLLQTRYAEAAQEFQLDLEIARELGDVRGQGIMLNSLGEVALLRREYAAAAASHREALGIDAGPAHAAHAHLGLARVLLAEHQADEADRECDRAQAILEAHPGIAGLPDVLVGLRGAIAWRRGDHAGGEQQLTVAIDALEAGIYPLDTIPLLYELRDLYQAQQTRAKAVVVMARALDLLSECGSERGVQDVEDWLRTVDTPNLIRLALEQYFPGWLVEDILGGRLNRPPTRRQGLAVLFSDVRGFTAMTQGLGAEQIVELLNDWFAEATRAIRRHRGVVDKFMGDAVMALFGVPEERDDAAADAVRAALAMRDALDTMNMRQKALGRPQLRIGIGIDGGEAVVGFIGSHLRRSYTAIGDVVNTAARLETATKEQRCDILISRAIQQRQGVAETRFVGNLELPGRAQPEPSYCVLGPLGQPGTARAVE